ncbi:hypothetical protein EDB19DRAFT_2027393 [Suillus lakei]|nr:hypothetical protein EDB19DRAFT_2027393 [Suillus lakei]
MCTRSAGSGSCDMSMSGTRMHNMADPRRNRPSFLPWQRTNTDKKYGRFPVALLEHFAFEPSPHEVQLCLPESDLARTDQTDQQKTGTQLRIEVTDGEQKAGYLTDAPDQMWEDGIQWTVAFEEPVAPGAKDEEAI